MKAFLGIFVLSVLLTLGSSLECETCVGQGTTCSGKKQTCPSGQDGCIVAVTELTAGSAKVASIMKGCYEKAACKELKPGASASFGGAGASIKTVECSKAPVSSGSFLLALSGLLLLKLLL
ncbi:phospholipase A2 inhibitor and Ly6/PLAUR domain-containing protein-like [Eublepharis macularius]|uniref:Phospholipase A2 inhibitor and Ly6/PLAUR domain-containing protein-like n=1 Tax=Eublepharis macularius TaxID=481883 RepID=A0AA97KE42_EUBMA|nr:phospholipase A2 inhibitor and Ly6/PLAUR domain-containing protein-like [Eublepharis macularius]